MPPSLSTLLSLLSDGEFHSGSAIGSLLGVSRAAVWKQLQRLADLGLELESVKGKGYRLVGGIELLDQPLICQQLSGDVLSRLAAIDVLLDTPSTNTHAMARASEGQAHGYVCLAEYQTAGRGRRGRQWVSPFGHNIYLSMVWEFEGGATQLEGLSLAVGVAIANALGDCGMNGISLKWPNDILFESRKLGGILLEMSGDPSGLCQVVVGIGLNVRMPEGIDIDQPWAAITQSQPQLSRNQLASGLIKQLVPMLTRFSEDGFPPYQQAWEAYDAYRDQPVTIFSGNHTQSGIARGVFSNGALRLEVDEEVQAIYGGEVSLRLA